MKKVVSVFVFILYSSLSIAQETMEFKNEVSLFDTVRIENPIIIRLLDVGQEYLVTERCLDSISHLYPQLTDSIMNLKRFPLYSCVFFKLIYYDNTSKEEYESFFHEEIDPSTVLRFKCPKLITVQEEPERNYSVKRMPTLTNSYVRVKISGRAYNYFVFWRVMDGPLNRPLYFEQPDSAVYILFPVNNN